jgi:hypothetical protein
MEGKHTPGPWEVFGDEGSGGGGMNERTFSDGELVDAIRTVVLGVDGKPYFYEYDEAKTLVERHVAEAVDAALEKWSALNLKELSYKDGKLDMTISDQRFTELVGCLVHEQFEGKGAVNFLTIEFCCQPEEGELRRYDVLIQRCGKEPYAVQLGRIKDENERLRQRVNALEEAIKTLRKPSATAGNILFNLSQPTRELTPGDRLSMKQVQIDLDAAWRVANAALAPQEGE